MSTAAYKLKLHDASGPGHTTQTLEQWGVLSATVTYSRHGQDEMRLTLRGGRGDAFALVPWRRLDLIRSSDGKVLFTGWVVLPRIKLRGGEEVHYYEISGPWTFLERYTYERNQARQDPAHLDTAAVFTIQAPRAGLFSNMRVTVENVEQPGGGTLKRYTFSKATLAEEVKAALDFAIASGAPIAHQALVDIEVVDPPQREMANAHCAAWIEAQMAWLPDYAMYWEYSAGAPKLRFKRASAGTQRTVKISQLDTEDYDASARHDILVRDFVVKHAGEQIVLASAEMGRMVWLGFADQTSHAAAAPFGRMVVERPLRQETRIRGNSQVPPETAPATNIAELLHRPFSSLYHDMSVRRLALEWSWRPGDKLSYIGVAALVGAVGIIQDITMDLLSGLMSVRAGPPVFRGFRDLRSPASTWCYKPIEVDALSEKRGEPPPTAGGGGGGGGTGEEEGEEEGEGDGEEPAESLSTFELTTCEDGELVTRNVVYSDTPIAP